MLIDGRRGPTKSLIRGDELNYETGAEIEREKGVNGVEKLFGQYFKSLENKIDATIEVNSNDIESESKNNRKNETNQKINDEQEKSTILKTQKIDDEEESKPVKLNEESVDEFASQDVLKEAEKYLDGFGDLKDLVRRNIRGDVEYLEKKERNPEVGFGGNPPSDPKRIVFGNMTTYINKVINHVQQKLKQNGRIYVNNPPYVIYKIPNTPISFNLKYIEGASTISKRGTSMGLHYFTALYCYTDFKFEEIRYYYDVQIKPMNLFTIHKSITVIVENSRVYMPVAVENNKFTIQRYEYVLPDVTVEVVSNQFINYILNDIVIDKYYPETKQKLAEIASRDTKLLLDAHLEDAQ